MSATNVTTRVAARSLGKTYRQGIAEVAVLDGIDVDFERGRLTALMGPTGCGKSTLLHCLAGLERPTTGEVWVGETGLATLDAEELSRLRREHIGFLLHNDGLLPGLTVAENLLLPFELGGYTLDHDYAELVMGTMGLGHLLPYRLVELSGSQRRRVAAARAFVGGPDVVLGDEPTATLDARAADELLGLLHRGVDRLDGSVIIATHDPVVGAEADRVFFLDAGHVAADLDKPTPREVMLTHRGLRRPGRPTDPRRTAP